MAHLAFAMEQAGGARQLMALAAEMLGYIQPRKNGPPAPELSEDPEADKLRVFTLAQRLGLFEPEARQNTPLW